MQERAPALQIVRVGGAPEGLDARLVSDWARRQGTTVVFVARDSRRVAELRSSLAFYDHSLQILEFPAWDSKPFERVSPRPDILSARLAMMTQLATALPKVPTVVLTTVQAAMQRLPPGRAIRESRFSARLGQRINRQGLIGFFGRTGYVRCERVTEPGEFAVRGELIDVFPAGVESPLRLSFFGDVLDSIRLFDVETQLTVSRTEHVDLYSIAEFTLDDDSIRRFRENYRAEFGSPGVDNPLYNAISEGIRLQGSDNYLPFFHDRLETLLDYLPGCTAVFDKGVDAAVTGLYETIEGQYEDRAEWHVVGARNPFPPCRPELLFLDLDALYAALGKRKLYKLETGRIPPGPGIIDAGGRPGQDFAVERGQQTETLMALLAAFVEQKRTNFQIIFACWSEGSRERLELLLGDEGVESIRKIENAKDLREDWSGVGMAVWQLERGFRTAGQWVVSQQDVFGKRFVKVAPKRRDPSAYLDELHTYSPGDLVVHANHGLGRYDGLETVTVSSAPHECMALTYAGGDRLYVPVENIDLVSRYSQGDGKLDRLGSTAWQHRKAKAKEHILAMAENLMNVAAARSLRTGNRMVTDQHSYESFVIRFQYEETEDQQAAIDDVLADMSTGQPMDRLICGDVGFGKTEVAMRAAFVAALDGWQVALVAPTTLLARQHYATFRDRFRGFPVKIAQLSRLTSQSKARQIRDELRKGRIEIVIGTHAVLSKQTKFSRLGLVIIDEEQSFGVKQKEWLKEVRTEVHVLSMTATPIPRTIQMAISGVRDMSVINTPPTDRIPIRTYVMEFDPATIREALIREHYRGGQSFFVVPRIRDLEAVETFLTERVPEVSYTVGHGRLGGAVLDRRTNDFYSGKYDVLLSTNIVAAGLDIPTANTMVVYCAERFGLSQLYQIRGRVGRSAVQGFAFITYLPKTRLTETAEKRLRVLNKLDTLGVGLSVASHDLDIRGAGNLLGVAQSGRIPEVGIELYQKFLVDAVRRLKEGISGEEFPAEDDWSPKISLGTPVMIPESYIEDLGMRLSIYRKMSNLQKRVELESYAAELTDRFGSLPTEVRILFRLMRIKQLCRIARISRLDGGKNGATIEFHNGGFINTRGLVGFVAAESGRARFRGEKLIIQRDWTKENSRIRGAHEIALALARIARQGAVASPNFRSSN